MKILVHFPTRGRKEQAAKTISGYWANASDPSGLILSLACNAEEDVPEHPQGAKWCKLVEPFPSKIAAYNAIPTNIEWDIVLGASDDMWCIQQDWDDIIREAMQANFPETDGCLWFSDGRQDRICTFSIMGRKAFEVDGYLYQPDYLSFWCDNEWTEVWQERQKLYSNPQCLFQNQHWLWGGVMKEDTTYTEAQGKKNAKWDHDKHLYYRRKIQGFPK